MWLTAAVTVLALVAACGSQAPATNTTCTLLDKEGPAAFNSLAMMAAIGGDGSTNESAKAWRDQTEAELNVCPQYRDAYHAWLDPSVRP
jgi:hypothetical protein